MVTGASALTAVLVWGRNQIEQRRQRRLARTHRDWNGYIDIAGVATWGLRLVERQPDESPERVTLDVVNEDGSANQQMAHMLRNVVEADRFLSRAPSPEQLEFLKDLRRQRPRGYPVM